MIIIQDFSCGRKGVNTAIFTRQTCMDSKVVRAEFGSGLIRNRAQTCCALKSSAPSGTHQDNCADLLGLQTRRGSNHSAANVGESNSRSNVFQIRRVSVCVPSRWKVLSGEFRRRPTALANKFFNSGRVGRRGLSAPREDFSRLPTYAIPWIEFVALFLRIAFHHD